MKTEIIYKHKMKSRREYQVASLRRVCGNMLECIGVSILFRSSTSSTSPQSVQIVCTHVLTLVVAEAAAAAAAHSNVKPSSMEGTAHIHTHSTSAQHRIQTHKHNPIQRSMSKRESKNTIQNAHVGDVEMRAVNISRTVVVSRINVPSKLKVICQCAMIKLVIAIRKLGRMRFIWLLPLRPRRHHLRWQWCCCELMMR